MADAVFNVGQVLILASLAYGVGLIVGLCIGFGLGKKVKGERHDNH